MAIDSTARKGNTVARRRFQKGTVYPNKTNTRWLGGYAEYVLDAEGVERRHQREVTLGLIQDITKRDARRLLQPHLDRVNPLLEDLQIPKAGFHAFRHFNVSMMDSLRVPLKVIQERIGHALTGSFTLDVYGGQPEWERNVEAARKLGAAIAEAVRKTENSHSLTTGNENGSQSPELEAVEN